MGRRGRLPDPNSKKSRAALARAKQLEAVTPRADSPSAPPASLKPPACLAADSAAIGFWNRNAPILIADGRLTADRVDAFALLCQLHADAGRLAEQVAAEGWITATDKGQAASPVAKLLRDSRRDWVTLARDFGLTAAAAARIPQEPPSGEEEGGEEEALLRQLSIRG